MFGIKSIQKYVYGLLMFFTLSLQAAAFPITEGVSHPVSNQFRLSDRMTDLKNRTVTTLLEMPTWGKCVTVGAVGGGVLFGLYALKSKIAANKFKKDLIENLVENKPKALSLLAQFDVHKQKHILTGILQSVISNKYTESQKAIFRAIINDYNSLFISYDWFLLWKHACAHEVADNQNLLRDWIAAVLVKELHVQKNDRETLELAVQSGVKEGVPVFQLGPPQVVSVGVAVGTLKEIYEQQVSE